MSDRLMTAGEVATWWAMSKPGLYRMVERGEVPHMRIGRNVRFHRETLEAWLEQHSAGNGNGESND